MPHIIHRRLPCPLTDHYTWPAALRSKLFTPIALFVSNLTFKSGVTLIMGEVVIRGSCACQSCTWSSKSAPQHLDFCYCIQCQQITGSAFGAWMGISRSSLDISGPSTVIRLSITAVGTTPTSATESLEIAARSFCTQCGGTLSIQYDCYPNKTHVAAGTIVTGAELVPRVGCHLFVAEKQSWFQICNDGLRRWESFDEEFLDVLEEWRAEKKERE